MNRRDLLKECGILLAAPTAIGLSGCSSSDGGDGNGGDAGGADDTPTDSPMGTDTPTPTDTQASTPSPTPTTTPTPAADDDGEPVGEVVDNAVEELEITDWSARIDDMNNDFVVTLSIENTGDQATELVDYWYVITLYDAEGTEIPNGGNSQSGSEKTYARPGEVGALDVAVWVENDNPEDVARYEIAMNCTLSDGVYCEE